ncbi:hypothetical protein GCM10025857_14170 [Alicyclobacillus contaminans]|nr:hypothetical protein GCM10025857_14170 [Alicyclobacillus contaminans]
MVAAGAAGNGTPDNRGQHMGKPMYRVERALNNNVLIVRGGSGEEEILVGRGIGFGVKAGEKLHRMTRALRSGSHWPLRKTRNGSGNCTWSCDRRSSG